MSVEADRGAWLVRWGDGAGRQRGKRFVEESEARAFDEALGALAIHDRSSMAGARSAGVYSYATKAGTRWYFDARGSDGTQLTKRGFTSERAVEKGYSTAR